MTTIIKGLKTCVVDNGITLFYNDDLLDKKIAFEIVDMSIGEDIVEDFGEDIEWDTCITVYHLNTIGNTIIDGQIYTLYWDKVLPRIQSIALIREVFEIYKANENKHDFIDVMKDISIQYMSSSMQSEMDKSDDVLERLNAVFGMLNEFIGGQIND